MNNIPENSWRLYLELVAKADKELTGILNGKPMGPLLNQFIHTLLFKQGICIARWINNNRELVAHLNEIQSFTKEEFDRLTDDIKLSVENLRH